MVNAIQVNNTQTILVAQATTSTPIQLQKNGIGVGGYCVMMLATNQTPSLTKTFVPGGVNTTTGAITITSHGYTTGLLGQLTTTGGLPTGLSTATNYFAIVIDANTIKFASSLVNANAGTFITPSTQGSGIHTFTPTTLSTPTFKLQGSLDGVTYADLATAAAITAGTPIITNNGLVYYNYLQAVFAIAAGQLSVVLQTVTKG